MQPQTCLYFFSYKLYLKYALVTCEREFKKKKEAENDKDKEVQDQLSEFAEEEIQQELEKVEKCGSEIRICKCCTC